MRGEQLPTPDPVGGLTAWEKRQIAEAPPADWPDDNFERIKYAENVYAGLLAAREQGRADLPKSYPLRCASCGDRATTTIILEGFRTPVCLRHYNIWRTPDFDEQGRADLAAMVEAVAALLCERHQYSSPTRQPCAACSQDARAVLTDPTEPCAEFGEHPRGGHADAVRRASDG